MHDSQDSDELQTCSSTGEIYIKSFHLHLIIWSYPQNPRNLTASLQCSHPACLLSSGGKCASSGYFPFPGHLDESNIGVGDADADRPRRNEVDGVSDGFSFKDVDSDDLSRKRRRHRPIFESIRVVQRLATRQDLGTTSQVSSGGTEELGEDGETGREHGRIPGRKDE